VSATGLLGWVAAPQQQPQLHKQQLWVHLHCGSLGSNTCHTTLCSACLRSRLSRPRAIQPAPRLDPNVCAMSLCTELRIVSGLQMGHGSRHRGKHKPEHRSRIMVQSAHNFSRISVTPCGAYRRQKPSSMPEQNACAKGKHMRAKGQSGLGGFLFGTAVCMSKVCCNAAHMYVHTLAGWMVGWWVCGRHNSPKLAVIAALWTAACPTRSNVPALVCKRASVVQVRIN
jgi:hypothetical protein